MALNGLYDYILLMTWSFVISSNSYSRTATHVLKAIRLFASIILLYEGCYMKLKPIGNTLARWCPHKEITTVHMFYCFRLRLSNSSCQGRKNHTNASSWNCLSLISVLRYILWSPIPIRWRLVGEQRPTSSCHAWAMCGNMMTSWYVNACRITAVYEGFYRSPVVFRHWGPVLQSFYVSVLLALTNC